MESEAKAEIVEIIEEWEHLSEALKTIGRYLNSG